MGLGGRETHCVCCLTRPSTKNAFFLFLFVGQVTQVRFRLPTGTMIARRFWLKDRVSLLFQYARTTVRGETVFFRWRLTMRVK